MIRELLCPIGQLAQFVNWSEFFRQFQAYDLMLTQHFAETLVLLWLS
jgi:hypothetical protein